MINDTPLTTGVNTLNAHDIAFYCCGNIFSELKLLAQQQRPTDNPFKNKEYCLHKWKRGDSAPPICLNKVPIEYIKTYRFLCMVFYALNLKWKSCRKYIQDWTLLKINILKAITAKQWGADCIIFSRLYKSPIHSRLD